MYLLCLFLKDQFRVFGIDQSGRERENNNLVLSTEDNVYWPLYRDSKADFFDSYPFVDCSDEGLMLEMAVLESISCG